MKDYKLYYWDAPFRGNFVELLLVDVNAKYTRHGATVIYPEKSLKISSPGMAPPYLYDCKAKHYLAQMPAILMYLGKKYDYLPKQSKTLALALKTILDCNDILCEITRFYGMMMWDKKSWSEFRSSRLPRWMQMFEKIGLEHGLEENKGFLLAKTISVADIAVAALFGTLIHCFPQLSEELSLHAPHIAELVQRIEARPRIQAFLVRQREIYGNTYCGGQIEKSLRKMIEKKGL